MTGFDISSLRFLLPEIALSVWIVVLLLADMVLPIREGRARVVTTLALLGIGVTFLLVLSLRGATSQAVFSGQVAIDPLGTMFKLLFLGVTAVAVLTGRMSAELSPRRLAEYYALLLSITLGMFLMASANDLLMVYLGVELVSIVSYAMAGYRLSDRKSSEAALKYVIYGGAASGMMLFGISLLYGLFGTTELTSLYYALARWSGESFQRAAAGVNVFPVTLFAAVALTFAGVAYKIAVVPFHMWSPDVYEGSPTPFTGFLSVGPKAAGFALLMRLFVGVFVPPDVAGRGFVSEAGLMPLPSSELLPVAAMLGVMAAVTMTLGNLAAIPQNNVKRLLAYSSIAHAGYLLMGFVVLSELSLQSVVYYLVVYYLMNLGAFLVCQVVRDRTGGETIAEFNALGQREPLLALAMAIFLFSLTGLPPFAGFFGKFYIFAAVVQRGGFWYWVLAVVAVVNSAISLYFYARIVKAMYLSPQTTVTPLRAGRGYLTLATVLAVPTLVLGLFWTPSGAGIKGSVALYRSAEVTQVAVSPVP